MSNIITFPTDYARGASPTQAAPGNVLRFPTAVARARAWIARIQHRRAQSITQSWRHTCAASGYITIGLIGDARCPFCDAHAPKPGDTA